MSPFGELLEKLARAEVHYVLVGGSAVLLHGHARTTADLDIVAKLDGEIQVFHVRAARSWAKANRPESGLPTRISVVKRESPGHV